MPERATRGTLHFNEGLPSLLKAAKALMTVPKHCRQCSPSRHQQTGKVSYRLPNSKWKESLEAVTTLS
eukprot:3225633-Amphidinium_carterae.1